MGENPLILGKKGALVNKGKVRRKAFFPIWKYKKGSLSTGVERDCPSSCLFFPSAASCLLFCQNAHLTDAPPVMPLR